MHVIKVAGELDFLVTAELQQIWKQMAENAALQAAFVAASSGGKNRNGSGEHTDNTSREKMFSSPHDDRGSTADMNGDKIRK